MRTLNFALVFFTALVCFCTYRVAEDARVAHVNLVRTEHQIAREHQTLVILGAEWGSLTRPQRIQALAERHLDLADAPAIQLSSITMLPRRGAGGLTDEPLRDARAIVPDAPASDDGQPPVPIRPVTYRTGA